MFDVYLFLFCYLPIYPFPLLFSSHVHVFPKYSCAITKTLPSLSPDPQKSSIYGNYYAVSPNTAKNYDLQPLTPEAPYSNMSLQDLQAKCDSYGLKRLNKERCIKKLKEIYSYLHRCEDLS